MAAAVKCCNKNMFMQMMCIGIYTCLYEEYVERVCYKSETFRNFNLYFQETLNSHPIKIIVP